jgi:quercetin dioxygenase-like cupin family protein
MQLITTFKDEAEAYAQIEAAGYYGLKSDFPALKNDFHWHDFDSLIYITSGELNVTEHKSGKTVTCGPGSKIIGKAGIAHSEESEGYSAILGLAVDPRSQTQPVDKPLPAPL